MISDAEAWKRVNERHPDVVHISDEEASRRANLIVMEGRVEHLAASSQERKNVASNNALLQLSNRFSKPRRK